MSTTEAPDGQRTLSEFARDTTDQCQAVAEYSGEQCGRDALTGVDYCHDHI